MTFIGIDPGNSGGVAVDIGGKRYIHSIPLITTKTKVTVKGKQKIKTKNDINVPALVDILSVYSPQSIVVIELVHAMPGNGAVSMFNFGKGYGILIGICTALGHRVELVAPQTWKKEVLKGTAKDKQAAIDFALKNYPTLDISRPREGHYDGLADAICLLEYGIRNFS